MKLSFAQPGAFSGKVRVRLGERWAALPLNIRVRPAQQNSPRLLISETPFQSDTTENGSDFQALTETLSTLPFQIDCLERLPTRLDSYRTILLAEGSLVKASDDEIARLRSWVQGGGRLILACDAFFVGTVPKANQILAGLGLEVVDQDYAFQTIVTQVTDDPLTRGVNRMRFHRPSLIHVKAPEIARGLALAPGGEGALIAVARSRQGGEVLVLGNSLWWAWSQHNATMLRNMLQPQGPSRKTGGGE
jgi:hypothetical protein